MIAYKFLGSECMGRFSDFAWPLPARGSPGEWVEAQPSRCASGVHACHAPDLPFWIDAELWRIELAGPIVEARRKVVAGRGRLVARIDAWDGDAMRGFAAGCAERTAARAGSAPELAGFVTDTASYVETGKAAVAGFVAARAAEMAAGVEGYEVERAAQSSWLANRLGL